MPINVTIVNADKKFLDYLKILLDGNSSIKVIGAFLPGEKAINAIADTPPDVAIVDLVFPDYSCAETIKRIKGFSSEIDVLVLTKFDDDGHLFSALKAGAVGYILKDTQPAEIIDAIEGVSKGHSPMSGKIARRVLQEFHKVPKVNERNSADLTPREKEVLKLLSMGHTPREIGKALSLKYESVRSHLKHTYKKLNAHSMPDAIARAKNKGLI
jgi:DNA-binding NarL/FixJ family response regulator